MPYELYTNAVHLVLGVDVGSWEENLKKYCLFIMIGVCIPTPGYKMLHSIPEYLRLEKNS